MDRDSQKQESPHRAGFTSHFLSFLHCQRQVKTCGWCPEGDSNSHSFRKRILNPPRLPIPPSGRGAQYKEVPLVGQSAFMVNFHTLG